MNFLKLSILAIAPFVMACEENVARENSSSLPKDITAKPIGSPDWLTLWDSGNVIWKIDNNSIKMDESTAIFNVKVSMLDEVFESESDAISEIDCKMRTYREIQSYTTSPKDYMSGKKSNEEWQYIRGGTPLSSLYNYTCLKIAPDLSLNPPSR